MAQPNGLPRINTAGSPQTPRARASPTFEQLLQGDASRLASSSPIVGNEHDHGEHFSPHNKKSVLTKVKERAKKMRQSLTKKKHGGHENGGSPSWGVTLDDDEEDEDPEYLGAPMYESDLAPNPCKETARQHPRAIPVVSEKHVLQSSVKHEKTEREKSHNPHSPNKTITETVSDKLGPAYAAVSDATHAIASKIADLTVATPAATEAGESAGTGMQERELVTGGRQQTWDKGVSVKEYLMQKLEPGEDERALSQVITEAISPKKAPGDVGVVEKVKEAVTSLLRNEESSQSTPAIETANSSSPIPVSTNPQRVTVEENHGRILQAN